MASGTVGAMRPEEGTDAFESFMRQGFGGVTFIPSTMGGAVPVQLAELLRGLEGPGLNNPQVLGWPLKSPVKRQKCDKCSREFWSPINYRRHFRVHRRPLNENDKSRDLLAAFWDALSLEQTKDILSFDGVMLMDIPGLTIIAALASSLRAPMIWSFPPVCVDAASALLDIIQAKASKLQINSHELFNILDHASEGTFLSAGTAESVQKYVFEGNTAKNSLELNNLVASTGFLFEQQLVKAWFADKDAEALRCQKLLVEEEEAAQRRQAAILEKKRQKKIRKEQKMKEIGGDNKALDVVESVDSPTSPEAFNLSSPLGINASSQDAPQVNDSTLESLQFKSNIDVESQVDLCGQHIQVSSETMGAQVVIINGPGQLTSNNWQVRKSAARPKVNVGQNRQTFKPNLTHKHATPRNQIQQNKTRVWTKKYEVDSDENGSKPPAFKEETPPQIEEDKCSDVKPPAFKEEMMPQIEEDKCDEVKIPAFEEEMTTPQVEEDKCSDGKPPAFKEETKPQIDQCDDVRLPAFKEEKTPRIEEDECDDVLIGSIPITLKSRREQVIIGSIPVTLKTKISSLAKKNARANLAKNTVGGVNDRAISGDCDNHGQPLVSSNANGLEGSLPFCSASAKEFMERRWNEANSAEHVKSVISSPPELPPSRCDETASQVPDIPKRSVLGNAENNQVGVGVQAKYRRKAGKALKSK